MIITSFLKIKACYRIFSFDYLSLPIVITTGLYRQSAAKLYKFFLNVAEKNNVYLSDLIWPSTDLTYYSNP